jgi:hypothetical protein
MLAHHRPTDLLYKQYGDTWYAEGWISAFGLAHDALFLHLSNNCLDQNPYDWYYGDEQVGPPMVRFDGTNIWASTPGSQKQINVNSYWYAGQNNLVNGVPTPICTNYSYTTTATVPKIVGSPNFKAPFSVR